MNQSRQILTAAQMQAAEAALIDAGETVDSLMERAGLGAADWVWRMAAGRAVTVLCGPGNNGGDGYVIARELARRGLEVKVVAPMEPATPAARNARALWGGAVVGDAHAGVLVDALFGTGLTRPLSGDLAALLARLAAQHHKRVAIDLPSGVDSDSGAILGEALPHYDLTISLGAWKWAHWLMPAAPLMGARRLVDIGVGAVAGAGQLPPEPHLAAPAADAHKYARGLVAIVAGDMPGAALLAARAAQHGGAGYVRLLGEGVVPADLVRDARPLAEALGDTRYAALLVGPGLGTDALARQRMLACLAVDAALVVDADAIGMLDGHSAAGRRAPLVITPHAGEFAAIEARLGLPAAGSKARRAQALAQACGVYVVAKGPDTVIAGPDGDLVVMPPASSWLSAAGTGDVLAGLIASRLACSLAPMEAASEACQLHAEAARLAGPAFSAGQLIDCIPAAYSEFL